MKNRAEHILGLLILSTVGFIDSLFLIVPITSINIWMLLTVAIISVILLALRTLIIWLCPVFVTYGIIIIFSLNIILLFIYLLGIAMNLLVNAIIDIYNAIETLSGHHHTIKHIKNIKMFKVSARNVVNYIRNIPTTCAPFDDVRFQLKYVTHYFIGNNMCAFSRSMWPASRIPSKTLSFSFANSAEPVTQVQFKNCDAAAPSGSLFYCVVLNIGFVVAEVVLPLLIIYVLWQIFGNPIKLTVKFFLNILIYAATEGGHILLYIFLIIES